MSFHNRPGWGTIFAMWGSSCGIAIISFFVNIMLGVVIGIFAGWLLSLIFVGSWICEGFNLLGIKVPPVDLFKIGAALGFIAGILKVNFIISNK